MGIYLRITESYSDSTAGNAVSPLLQLPQEWKNMIYKHVLPGQQVVHLDSGHSTRRRFHLASCHENLTEKKAEQKFQPATGRLQSLFSEAFKHGPVSNNLAIRNIHPRIGIVIDLRGHEYAGNKALSLMVRTLPGVNNIYITIDQQYRRFYGVQRVFTDPITGKNLFTREFLSFASCHY